MDLASRLPTLIEGRDLDGVGDVAAVLQYRVAEWVKTSGRKPEMVGNLGPAAVNVADPEMLQALQERRQLIEQHAPAEPAPRVQPRRRPPPEWFPQVGPDRSRGMGR